jgi:2-dehydro-3-deoxygluconokinase
MPSQRIACIGECMIELAGLDFAAGSARIGFAGDTANTAIYLARLGAAVAYLTNVGTDALSEAMLARLTGEGVDCALAGRHPDRLPGLYAIETDATGERTFRYWRSESAARTLFSGIGPGLAALEGFGTVYLSGITLAILPQGVRDRLVAALGTLKARGVTTVFDSNYRPRLWRDHAEARDCFDAVWSVTSLALPSRDDEAMLRPGITAESVADRLCAAGAAEVVVKDAAAGPVIATPAGRTRLALPRAERVVDTSGAGDSFNAAYIAARLRGLPPAAAAAAGHRLAMAVIACHGAVIPRESMPA